MYYAKIILAPFFAFFLGLTCSNMNPLSNLIPDGTDMRTTATSTDTFIGLQPGDTCPDLTFYNSDGTIETLSNILISRSSVVLYFTMWCPFCDIEMNDIRSNIKPAHTNAEFYLIDYVANSVQQTLENQTATGYLDFKAAYDQNAYMTDLFSSTMGSTIVIDKNFIVQLNENYKNGQRLSDVLNAIP